MKDFMRRHFQRETTHQPPCSARPYSPSIEICERPYHNTKVVILLRAFLSTLPVAHRSAMQFELVAYSMRYSYCKKCEKYRQDITFFEKLKNLYSNRISQLLLANSKRMGFLLVFCLTQFISKIHSLSTLLLCFLLYTKESVSTITFGEFCLWCKLSST